MRVVESVRSLVILSVLLWSIEARAELVLPDELEAGELEPANVHIIDVEAMHTRDCRADRIRGGECVIRGFEPALADDVEPTDVGALIEERAAGQRIDMLERVLDALDALP